jgi:flagellum-specific ATP synthase
VLKSASRVMTDLVGSGDMRLVRQTLATLDVLERNRQLVDIGAYAGGSNPELDRALLAKGGLQGFLQQAEGGVPSGTSWQALRGLAGDGAGA